MNRIRLTLLIILLALTGMAYAVEVPADNTLNDVVNVLKYYRAIHVMAMLLVGFGFLMVFVKMYGRTALTATYLLVSIAIPLYFFKSSHGIMGEAKGMVDNIILAEFAAASLLICAGAVLGRIKLWQYIVLGMIFVPCYALNEWILLEGGLGLIPMGTVMDTGGSIVIHAFGALFGLGAIFSLTTQKEYTTPIEADATSDRFSLLGSMVLWVFWPSFCSALVSPAEIPLTIVNVILALCGSTLATYFFTTGLRKKVAPADIANAALAGGVAIGSTCNLTTPGIAFVIGILAGALSTFGFAVLQGKLQSMIKKVDTCGVLYLHGLPGLMGGLAALFVVSGINPGSQLKGIGITIVIGLVAGLITGKVIALTGKRAIPYEDEEELITE
ncbi:MAG: ammonium transporter [Candidatus Cloacimonetes bacterium HGW-Cloacimonetes-1]|jgi:ammonium transporter Rh|nr:MAG: ammonium transporter [Candidatus Cloacimonetes bacterium HGW-Cloacimonetes-1]